MKKKKGGRLAPLSCAGFVLVFGFLAISSSFRHSPTIDEPVHLIAGYSYLKWGDFRVNPEHPPLAKIWAALPLLALEVKDPRPLTPLWQQILDTEPGGPVYPLAEETFFKWNDGLKLFFFAKLQMVLLGMVLGCFVYRWSRELFGPLAAIVSLFCYALDPNMLAHSSIIHTDMPFTALMFIGSYFFYRGLRDLTWLNLSLLSLSFGLAATTKHSFIVLVPIWLALASVKLCGGEPISCRLFGKASLVSTVKQKVAALTGVLFCLAVTGYFAIWAVYGFRFEAVPSGETRLYLTPLPATYSSLVGAAQAFIVDHRLFPEAWVAGYLYNLKIWRHSAYLLGEISADGFWSYFPVAFAVKTPLPTLLLLAAAAVLLFHKPRSNALAWLVIPPLAYFLLAILSRFNLGIRHLLPVYPFLFVLIGGAVERLWREGSRLKKGGLAVLGLWVIGSSLSAYPHYLAYFNELAGGPRNGHKWLLDSNLDWGQDLKGLKKWMDQNRVEKIQLVYFGTASAAYYGIDDFYAKERLAGRGQASGAKPELPEYLALSANFLYGGELFLPKELAERLGRYRLNEPIASIGHSILIFKLDLRDSRVYQDGAAIVARAGAMNLAEALLHEALRLDPASGSAWSDLGGMAARQGKWNDAEAHYRAAIKVRPDFAENHLKLGRILAGQGRFDAALASLRAAVRLEPESADAHQSLAQLLARVGGTDEAARHYQEALRVLRQRRAAN